MRINFFKKDCRLPVLVMLWLLLGLPAKSQWHLLLEPYMMFPNMNGNLAIASLPVSNIDLNPGDIFNHLQVGAMLYTEVYNTRWMFSSDLTYMHLGQDIAQTVTIASGHISAEQWGWELAALRRLKPWLAVGIAGQLNSINSDLFLAVNDSAGAVTGSASLTKTWVDPSVVAAVKLPLKSNWTLRFRGNIGGFGIGSKIYWQAQAYADYHFSNFFQVSAGYRAIKMDYETGSGKDYFLYNVTTFGPVVRLGLDF